MNDRMSGRGLLLAVITALCSGVGITMLKSGTTMLKSGLDGETLGLMTFVAGLVIYGVGILGGIVLFGKYPISVSYPVVVGLSLVVVAAIAVTTLGEMLTPFKLAGTVLIVGGVAVLVRPGSSRPNASPPAAELGPR